MKRYILWDHDGVLVDTEPCYFEATRSTLRELGVDLGKEDYLDDMAIGRSAWERAKRLGVTDERIAAGKRARNALYQRYLSERDIDIPGVGQVLGTLAAHYAMAIVTTAKREDFDLIHRDRNLVRHMAFVLASGDYPRAKPAPDPYLEALSRFGAAPGDAVVVEDSERGLRAAVAAGIDCVIIDNDFVKGQDFRAATHHIRSITALPALLAGL